MKANGRYAELVKAQQFQEDDNAENEPIEELLEETFDDLWVICFYCAI